ncbi:MAG TPA: hypothetical protein PLY93_14645, partial [Turneriella sp.]|nr:hypothetical protein [Turneriella sp.]
AGMALRTSTTWSWEVDFPGTYTVRVNDGSVDCSAGTVIASGPVVMNTTVTTTIQDTDLLVQLNSIKVCFVPQGGGSTVVSSTKSVWRIEPQNVNTTYAKVNFNRGEIPTLALADIFKPTTAIKEIRFICPAGSTGVDTPACTQPVPSGTNLQPQGAGSVEVNTAYTLPTSSRVSTVAYDVRITLCDTSPTCAASAPPVFGTETAAPYAGSGGATIKVYFLQDKTAGNSIFVATTGNDTYPGTNRLQPKKTLSAAVAVASGGKAIYVVGGNYCSVGDIASCLPTAGALSLPAGTSIYGGFTSGWYRPDVATNRAVITAGSNASAHSIGVSVGAVNTPVFVEGLDVTARRATADLTGGYNTIGLRAVSGTSTLTLYKNKITAEGDIALSPGPNPGGSYGAVFNNFTAGGTVILDTNTIIAGQGWRGLSGGGGGATGAGGGTGGNGQGGIEGCVACCNDSTWHAPGGAGGTGGAGTSNRGGNGGSGGYQDDGGSGCGARGGC